MADQPQQSLGTMRDALQSVQLRHTPTPNAPSAAPQTDAKPKLDAQGRAYATGKRKNAVARVWVKPGTGKITVNGRDSPVYFA
jgi:hypothetical protein